MQGDDATEENEPNDFPSSEDVPNVLSESSADSRNTAESRLEEVPASSEQGRGIPISKPSVSEEGSEGKFDGVPHPSEDDGTGAEAKGGTVRKVTELKGDELEDFDDGISRFLDLSGDKDLYERVFNNLAEQLIEPRPN